MPMVQAQVMVPVATPGNMFCRCTASRGDCCVNVHHWVTFCFLGLLGNIPGSWSALRSFLLAHPFLSLPHQDEVLSDKQFLRVFGQSRETFLQLSVNEQRQARARVGYFPVVS
eukprot:INCI5881.2.p1 GENE.INCI5881.2~~INCI5881.2.p1  ORF type:complete len:113 (-),score=12.14 INCI5881.2:267-605(-)